MTRLTSRNKLLLAITVILVCSFLGVSYVNYMLTRASVRHEILQNNLPLTMDNIYSELSAEIMRPLLVSSSMASDTFLKDWVVDGEQNPDKVINYLLQIKERYGFFTTFFISSASNVYYRFNGINKTIATTNTHDIWYYDFVGQDDEYVFNVDTDEASNNTLTIFINYKVFDSESRLLGVTGVGLKVDKVASLVEQYQKKYQRTVYLSDLDGLIQVHPDTGYIDKKSVADIAGLAPLMEEILAVKDVAANFNFQRQGERIFLTVRFIEPFSWFLYVEQNETEALRTAKNNFIRTLVFGVAASGFIILLTLATINRYQRKLEVFAVSDELTGVANRRKLESEFERSLYAHSRFNRPFNLLLMDLDGFKKVNDSKGHLAGDKVLVNVAKLIKGIIRPSDVLARWGGDEFAVLCSGSNEDGAEDGAVMAERIRLAVRMTGLAGSKAKLDDPGNLVTVSCGISCFQQGDDLDSMLQRADAALYRCKARGGNCVSIDEGNVPLS